jgi:hypothetical protein
MSGLHFTIRETNQQMCLHRTHGILFFATNYSEMNECDAPGSNKIIAGTEFDRKRI